MIASWRKCFLSWCICIYWQTEAYTGLVNIHKPILVWLTDRSLYWFGWQTEAYIGLVDRHKPILVWLTDISLYWFGWQTEAYIGLVFKRNNTTFQSWPEHYMWCVECGMQTHMLTFKRFYHASPGTHPLDTCEQDRC